VAGAIVGQTGGQNMRKRYRKILVAAGATLASMALLASVAGATPPAAPYKDFAGCPNAAENEFIASCEKLELTGGHISFGSRDIPITNTIQVRGGFESVTGGYVFNSEGGIIPVRQTVPGGVIGMTGLKSLDSLSEKALKLNATVELAGQPGSVFESAWPLPIKLHLESPLLGKGCYVGSNADPIDLGLTVGTTNPPAPNKPISGQSGSTLTPEAGRPAVELSTGGVLVDNSHSVPTASGCQLEIGNVKIPVNSLVDAAYHLPAAAGTNEAILDFNVAYVSNSVIYP
jgi:hypothetical protein